MKKILYTTMILFFYLFVYSREQYPKDIQKIINRKKIIVAMYYQDFEPFFMVNNKGELYGLDVDISKDIAEQLGVAVEFNRKAKTFNEVVEIVKRGDADIAVSVLSRTLKRAQQVLFTNPYIILHQGMLVNRVKYSRLKIEDDPVRTLPKMDIDIGVTKGSSYVLFAKDFFPRAAIKEYDTWNSVFSSVVNEEIIAAYSDEIEIIKSIRRNPETSLFLKFYIFEDKTDPISIAVGPDSHNLLQWLNIYLETNNIRYNPDELITKYPEVFKNR